MTYVPSTDADIATMLEAIGVSTIDELFIDIPEEVRDPKLDIPAGLSELEVIRHLSELAGKNTDLGQWTSFLGAGWYDHHIAAYVDQLLLRSEFYTAYTPYQPEVSQGTLQSIYEFQSFICDLTGLEVSNASMYDGGSALAEAIALTVNATGRTKIVIADTVDPNYRKIVNTYLKPLDVAVHVVRNWGLDSAGLLVEEQSALASAIDDETACIVFQRPNFFGWLEETESVVRRANEVGALVVGVADPAMLGVLRPPGEIGAEVAVGELRHLMGPPSLGGPGAGYFATSKTHMRRLPGRIVGRTRDAQGRVGYVLTLQTREQHIRRERASSNICTNEALVALGATLHLAGLGRNGLRQMGELCIRHAHRAIASDWPSGYAVATRRPIVREFPVKCPIHTGRVNRGLHGHGIIGGFELGSVWPELSNYLLCAFTEKTGEPEIARFMECLPRESA